MSGVISSQKKSSGWVRWYAITSGAYFSRGLSGIAIKNAAAFLHPAIMTRLLPFLSHGILSGRPRAMAVAGKSA
ncbi:hypothetical protein COO59_09605 [Mixta theicola]|uniref:Uncharacterized protein n=1 Tax=Mixta theicola TaxID=1458355 RepID=A0A2K1Q9M8_9GAMM|nr:hypothetical protein COO59_09605 [Mixta theicola]GLR07662.1 hypothetical protein GCM10007905_03810 [Mixta theicola]